MRIAVGAGLLVWLDSNDYVRLERAAIRQGENVITYVNFEQRRGGRLISSQSSQVPDQPLTLRLERRGAVLTGSFRAGDAPEKRLPEMKIDDPAEVKVGVVAVNVASDPFEPEFSKLDVRTTSQPGENP